MRIATLDIGSKNFAYYVEDVDVEIIKRLKRIYKRLPKIYRRRVKGPMNIYIRRILRILYVNSQRVVDGGELGIGVVNVRERKDIDEIDFEARLNLWRFLDSKRGIWDTCNKIVIEQQFISGFSKGGMKINIKAVKFGECCLMWFLSTYGMSKEIIVFGSSYKTQTLGAPEGLTKYQRKKWSVEEAKRIFAERGDDDAIDLIGSLRTSEGKKQKGDDVCDCVTTMQAFKFIKMIVDAKEKTLK